MLAMPDHDHGHEGASLNHRARWLRNFGFVVGLQMEAQTLLELEEEGNGGAVGIQVAR